MEQTTGLKDSLATTGSHLRDSVHGPGAASRPKKAMPPRDTPRHPHLFVFTSFLFTVAARAETNEVKGAAAAASTTPGIGIYILISLALAFLLIAFLFRPRNH